MLDLDGPDSVACLVRFFFFFFFARPGEARISCPWRRVQLQVSQRRKVRPGYLPMATRLHTKTIFVSFTPGSYDFCS